MEPNRAAFIATPIFCHNSRLPPADTGDRAWQGRVTGAEHPDV